VPYRNWLYFHHRSQRQHNRWYNTRKPRENERRIQQLVAIFQMTYVGAPMIFYGDEAGMWGANDPCCRKPMVWPEMEYEPETVDADGRERAEPDPVHFDHDLFRHYRRLIHIRNRSEALQVGDYRTLLCDDERGLFVFSRRYRHERVIVALNKSRRSHTVTLDQEGSYRDLLEDRLPFAARDGQLRFDIPPQWARIMRSEVTAGES
jgi:glycosidase